MNRAIDIQAVEDSTAPSIGNGIPGAGGRKRHAKREREKRDKAGHGRLLRIFGKACRPLDTPPTPYHGKSQPMRHDANGKTRP